MPVYRLSEDLIFPPVHMATEEGLLAVGGDLTPGRLLLAYKMGIFPWYGEGEPILWWSPDPRLILYPDQFYVSRSLKKVIRKEKFKTTIDQAFNRVIHACADTRKGVGEGTWITDEMIEAYCCLNRLGYAHSVETWYENELVGGLYGISLGHCFFGESMFSKKRDASKVALFHLTQRLIQMDIGLIDCQVFSAHLLRLGAHEITRETFIALLGQALRYPTHKGPWSIAQAM